jgi:glycosyltransferase involved in cell wall biosynthesis
MKRILLLTYYFPPCNLTASQRPYSWARYLNHFGYYPIVITRSWDREITDPRDVHRVSGHQTEHEVCDGYEIYRLPYFPGWRDRLFTHGRGPIAGYFHRFLTLVEVFMQNVFWWAPAYRNLFFFAIEYAQKHRSELHGVLVTANPYTMFFLGYKVHKKTGLPWVADYRDDWTSRGWGHWFTRLPVLGILGRWLETRNEQKWLSTASGFVSISPEYVKSIGMHVNRPGEVVYNGYVDEDFARFRQTFNNEVFTVVYNGTLIPMQNIEMFLSAWIKMVDMHGKNIRMKLFFLGTAYDQKQKQRIEKYLFGYEDYFEVSGRMPRNEVIRKQSEAHLLLMVAYGAVKGSPGTKIFDYIACHKPVVLCPSDHDVIEQILTSSELAMIANDKQEAEDVLELAIAEFQATGNVKRNPNKEILERFSRFNQTRVLSEALNKFLP